MKNTIFTMMFLVGILISPSISCEGEKGIPKAIPPGFPSVGLLEQHMYEGMGNFVQVDRIWNDKEDILRYYYNSKYVKNDIGEGIISVWFLEEYTPAGREMTLADWKSKGVNVELFKDMKYKYYQIDLAYTDSWGNGYESEFDYEFSIAAGGEVCDSKMKVLHLLGSTKFQKLTTRNMPYIKLGGELKKKYDLK